MRIYRIARRRFVSAPFTPFDGEGAFRGGSRWNTPGHRMSLAAQSMSLAMLEYLVHIDWQETQGDDLVAVVAEIPEADVRTLPIADLPANWRDVPREPGGTRILGDRWLASGTSLGLVVPSAVVPIEWNLLVNPQHANVNHLHIVSMDSFAFDTRLLGT